MAEIDPEEYPRRPAAQSLASDDVTGWFERLCRAAVPWDRGDAHPSGGTLVVTAAVLGGADPTEGPPWPLIDGDITAFATAGVEPVRVDSVPSPPHPAARRWLAEFRRPAWTTALGTTP
jgi:hypothetical protein